MKAQQPIGVFDSGYGGLTILKEIVKTLPAYDYIYLGDNARAPYGSRSYDSVYRYTLQCVEWLFDQGCPLVILACNTASAKALRTIQQKDLIKLSIPKKVLGIIRPTTEVIGHFTSSGAVGILATSGTVHSGSYIIEIEKFFPGLQVFQEACPMWVPLVENNEHLQEGADYFVKKHLDQLLSQSQLIDTILLACTHYPLLTDKIMQFIRPGIKVVTQGDIIARSLADYLQRHPEVECKCSKGLTQQFYTTDSESDFDNHARLFFGRGVKAQHLDLSEKKQQGAA